MNSNELHPKEISFEDILKLDKISVRVAPEKKGLILKHIEYEIRSHVYDYLQIYCKFQYFLTRVKGIKSHKLLTNNPNNPKRYKCVVLRRFKEFVSLYDLLVIRFPFRLIPALPSKKFYGNGDIHFVEERRTALERFLNLVARHPLLSTDSLVYCFLTVKSDELEAKIKENFRNPSEEYSIFGTQNNNDVPEMDMAKFPLIKEQLRLLQQSLMKLSRSAAKSLELNKNCAIETLDFGKEIKTLLTQEDNLLSNELMLFNTKINTEYIFSQFISISEQTNSEVQQQEDSVVEPINLYLDILSAYKDLCDRYENDLRKTSKESNSMLKRQTSRQTSIEESLEEMEKKSHFALRCIFSETLLVRSYSKTIPFVLKNLVTLKIDSHNKFAQLFNSMNF